GSGRSRGGLAASGSARLDGRGHLCPPAREPAPAGSTRAGGRAGLPRRVTGRRHHAARSAAVLGGGTGSTVSPPLAGGVGYPHAQIDAEARRAPLQDAPDGPQGTAGRTAGVQSNSSDHAASGRAGPALAS